MTVLEDDAQVVQGRALSRRSVDDSSPRLGVGTGVLDAIFCATCDDTSTSPRPLVAPPARSDCDLTSCRLVGSVAFEEERLRFLSALF